MTNGIHSARSRSKSKGEIVEISLSGRVANVRLMDGSNFNNYRNGKQHRYHGGLAKQTPIRLEIPFEGDKKLRELKRIPLRRGFRGHRSRTALFSHKADDDFLDFLIEKFVYNSRNVFPFDAFILLDHGAYFSDNLRDLRVGIERGLSPNQVQNDSSSQDRLILEDCIETRIPNGYRVVSAATSESALLSLAALSTLVTSGDEVTQALLSACIHPRYNPIF